MTLSPCHGACVAGAACTAVRMWMMFTVHPSSGRFCCLCWRSYVSWQACAPRFRSGAVQLWWTLTTLAYTCCNWCQASCTLLSPPVLPVALTAGGPAACAASEAMFLRMYVLIRLCLVCTDVTSRSLTLAASAPGVLQGHCLCGC